MGGSPTIQKVKKAAKTAVRAGAATMTFGSSEALLAASKVPGEIKEGKLAEANAKNEQGRLAAEDAADKKKRAGLMEAKRKSLLSFSQTGPLGLAGSSKANTSRKKLLGN